MKYHNKNLGVDYHIITTHTELKEYLADLSRHEVVFDTESESLDYHSELYGISLCDGIIPAAFILFQAKWWPTGSELTVENCRDILNEFFQEVTGGIAHNFKYDSGVFKTKGIYCDIQMVADTSAYVGCFDPELEKNLETRVTKDFKYSKKKFGEIVLDYLKSQGKKTGNAKKVDWQKTPWGEEPMRFLLAEYSCEDAHFEYLLYKKYKPMLEAEDLLKVHDKIELPLTYVLRDMETTGVLIDKQILYDQKAQLEIALKEHEDMVHKQTGCVFNLNSPKQVGDVLYKRLGYPVLRETDSGNASTNSETLEELASMGYEVAKLLVEHSELDTLYSSFVSKIPELVSPIDHRLHCNYNSMVRTGRMSCSNPNLQNQPNNDQYPVRAAFIAKPHHKLIIADLSQIEPRLMAHMSKDPKLLDIFNTGGDIYQGIADDLGVTRPAAKIIQLAISYGMGPAKLSRSLGIPVPKAQGIIESYYDTYNYFAGWKKNIEQKAQDRGYVKNMYGRIRRIPLLKLKDGGSFFAGLRQAVNTVIQGSAADYIKLVMINMYHDFKRNNLPAQLLLQVHDELVVECPDEFVAHVAGIQNFWMENVTKLRIPVLCEQKICDNWAQMKSKEYHGYDAEEVTRNAVPYASLDPTKLFVSRPSAKTIIHSVQKDVITDLINTGILNFN